MFGTGVSARPASHMLVCGTNLRKNIRSHRNSFVASPLSGLKNNFLSCSASFQGFRPTYSSQRRHSSDPSPTSPRCASEIDFQEIPIFDMSKLVDSKNRTEALQELRDLSHVIGFLYVINHGVPEVHCKEALSAAEQFFALPEDTKMAIHHSRSPAFRGYICHAAENTSGLPDLREQIEFGVEGDAVLGEGDRAAGVFPVYRRLVGPNQWPDEGKLPGFRSTMEAYEQAMRELSVTLMEALVEALGLPKSSLAGSFSPDPNIQMKIARYPPASSDHTADAEGFYGVGPHTDSGFLSILLQDAVGGLQVRNGAGEWVDAPPLEGALVVNIGEMLQLASSGYYLATLHRVLPPPAGGPARLSVPYFFNPRLDAEITPLPLPDELPWRRPAPPSADASETHGGRNKLLSRYGDNAFKSLARSHPSILSAHHPDLAVVDGSVVVADGGAGRP